MPGSSATSRSLCCLRAGKLARQWTESVNTRGIAGEDRRRTVALVDVEVDHQRMADQPLGQQHPSRHGDVVEHAEAGAEAGERVVAAAGGVAGDAVLQRQPGGQHGAGDGAAAAQRQHRRERQAQPPDRRRVEPLLQHGGDVEAVVRELEPGARCGFRHELLRGQQQTGTAQMRQQMREFRHREAMRRRQRRHIGGMVDDGCAHASELAPAGHEQRQRPTQACG